MIRAAKLQIAAVLTKGAEHPHSLPEGASDALAVQSHRDGPGGLAHGTVTENAAHDCGLVDGAITAYGLATAIELLHHIVAIAEATAGFAVLDAAAQ